VILELATPDSPSSFEKGQRVQIKYWREETLYCWDAEVIKAGENEFVTLLISDIGVSLNQRIFHRMPLSLPFSFTVVGPAKSQTRGQRFDNCQTQDISLGGLGFQTPVDKPSIKPMVLEAVISKVRSFSGDLRFAPPCFKRG